VGEDIGDIDVLVIDHEAKLVLAIEVKDFEFARTPVELKHELDKLFIGDKSTLFHHKERLRLLETNLEQIHQHFALQGEFHEWHIQGEIVASRDLLANHLDGSFRSGITHLDVKFRRSSRTRRSGRVGQT
jgi:hypothetical protein